MNFKKSKILTMLLSIAIITTMMPLSIFATDEVVEEKWAHQPGEDGLCEVCQKPIEAEYNGCYYVNIDDAVDDAYDGATIKVYQDINRTSGGSIGITSNEPKSVTIDLNGHDIAHDNATNFETLSIDGPTTVTLKNGSVSNYVGSKAIYVVNEGKLIIKTNDVVINGSIHTHHYTKPKDGSVKLTAGYYKNDPTDLINTDRYTVHNNLDCENSRFEGNKYYFVAPQPEARVLACSFPSVESAIENSPSGEDIFALRDIIRDEGTLSLSATPNNPKEFLLDLQGYSISNPDAESAYHSYEVVGVNGPITLTIRNGVINPDNCEKGIYVLAGAKLILDSNDIVVKGRIQNLFGSVEPGTVEISGGLYTNNPSRYVIEGYKTVYRNDGYYEVVPNSSFVIKTNPLDTEVDDNEFATFTAEADIDGLSYQWSKSRDNNSWIVMEDETEKTLEVLGSEDTFGTYYRCAVSDGGVTKYSLSAKLSQKEDEEETPDDPVIEPTEPEDTPTEPTESENITVMVQPEDVYGTEGNATFNVQAVGENLTYQWQYSLDNGANWENTPYTGKNTDTLYVGLIPARDKWLFRCILSNEEGSVSTETAMLHFGEKASGSPVITKQPEEVYGKEGTADFKVEVEGGGVTYKWQYSPDNGSTWEDAPYSGKATDTLHVGFISARDKWLFRCVITNEKGTVTTEPAMMHFGEKSTGAPSITTQPEEVYGTEGNATFNVVATGGNLTYKWQYSTDEGSTWEDAPYGGKSTDTLNVGFIPARDGWLFRCILTNENGTATTNSVALHFGEKASTAPAITEQPEDVYGTEGNASISLTATGAGLTYEWEYSIDGETWEKAPYTGRNTDTLSVGLIPARNNWLFRCIVSNSEGTLVSESAKMHYASKEEGAPKITEQEEHVYGTTGNATLKVVTTGAGLKYLWQYSVDNGATWDNAPYLGKDEAEMAVGFIPARDNWQFRCIVSNSCGTVTSKAITMHFGEKADAVPVIETQPSDVSGTTGNASITLTAKGDGLTYKWEYSTDGETWQDAPYAGRNTNTMLVGFIKARDNWKFRCTVTNSCGSVMSNVITMHYE